MTVGAGILDTSVIIDLPLIEEYLLPVQSAITAVTLAELAAGPHATNDPGQRAIRQERLQWAEATFDALAFDAAAARSYGRVYALVREAQSQPPARSTDLMIAAIAASNRLPIFTRNPADFAGLQSLVTIMAI